MGSTTCVLVLSFTVRLYMCVCCYVANFFSADDDELTFDPGETITNIEFVSSVLSNSDTILRKYSYDVTIMTGLLCNL